MFKIFAPHQEFNIFKIQRNIAIFCFKEFNLFSFSFSPSGVSVSVSCFTLVAISLERYFAICRPLHSRTWQTVTHAYVSIAICWGLSAVVTIPIAIYTTLRPIHHINKCTEEWPNKLGEQIYTAALDFILLLIPIFIMSMAYGMVCYTLWKGIHMDARAEKGKIISFFFLSINLL